MPSESVADPLIVYDPFGEEKVVPNCVVLEYAELFPVKYIFAAEISAEAFVHPVVDNTSEVREIGEVVPDVTT